MRAPGLAVVALLLAQGVAAGQSVLRVDVGTQSAQGAYAVRTRWFGQRTQGWFAVAGGPEGSVGGWIRTKVGGLHLGAGDTPVDLSLPWDRLTGSPGVVGRGFVVADSSGAFRWNAFAGWGARARPPVAGLLTSETGEPAARLDARYSLTPTLEWKLLQTWTKGGGTHVHSLVWEPIPDVKVLAGGGSMDHGPYGAVGGFLRRPTLDLALLWTGTTRSQRRLAVQDFYQVEAAGLNGRVVWRPVRGWYLEAARIRQNPSPLTTEVETPRTIHQLGAGISPASWLSLRGGVHHSPDPLGGVASRGAHAGLSTQVSSAVRVEASYYLSQTGDGWKGEMATLRLKERIRPGLELLQRLTSTGWGTPSLTLGGRYERGGTSVGVDHRTDFVPTATGSQFRTALVLDIRLQISSTWDLAATTFLDAFGNAVYQVRTGQWLYPGGASSTAGPGYRRARVEDFSFPAFLIEGRVVLADDTPVEGAAVSLGERVVFTDPQGRFLLRTNEEEVVPFEVLLDEFLMGGEYRVLDAPETVRSFREGSGQETRPETRVVLERVVKRRGSAQGG